MRAEHWNANHTVNITGHALAPPIQVWFGSVPADNRTLQMLNHQHSGFRIAVPPQTAGLTRHNLSPLPSHPLSYPLTPSHPPLLPTLSTRRQCISAHIVPHSH